MTRGSEKFAWKQYPSVPRSCGGCGKQLRVKDVARIHNFVSGRSFTTVFYCRECA